MEHYRNKKEQIKNNEIPLSASQKKKKIKN